MNKKAAEMTIGTIVVIILALVVLVVLIYGFTTGWGNLWQRLTGFTGGEVNVQTVVQSCQLACSTSAKYDYCLKERNVIFDEGSEAEKLTCRDLENRVPSVGLSSCSSINCVEGTYECLSDELKEAVCTSQDGEDCDVQWMSKNAFDRRKRGEYDSEADVYESYEVLEDVGSYVASSDLQANSGMVCAKFVPGE